MSMFSENVKFLRKEKGHTQDSLALELGMTRASICAYEDGRAMPPYPKLKALAIAFDTSVSLLTDQELSLNKEPTTEYLPDPEIESTEKLDTLELSDLLHETLPEKNEPSKQSFQIPILERHFFESYGNGQLAEKNFTYLTLELPPAGSYMAFRSDLDFPLKNCLIIGRIEQDFWKIKDGDCYVLVSKKGEIVYRKVYSQIKSKGSLILSAEVSGIETSDLALSEIKEVWKVEAYIAYQAPEIESNLDKASELAKNLKQELDRLRRMD